jgi:hypothetical protein
LAEYRLQLWEFSLWQVLDLFANTDMQGMVKLFWCYVFPSYRGLFAKFLS